MKKLILCCLLFLPFGIKAVDVKVDYIDNVYSNRPVNNEVLSGQLGYIYVDNNFAYCLDPSQLIITGENHYQVDNLYLNNNFSKEEIDYINLVAYFGYEYPNHNNEFYYMAAQELIWEKLYHNDFYWTNQKYPNGDKIDIEKYKKEINDLITNLPFLNKSYDTKVNEEIILEDENLDIFDVVSNDDIEIIKKDNKLFITPKKAGNYKIKLQHKNNKKSLLIFSAPNYQTIGSMGSNILLESEFSLNVTEEVIEDVLPNTSNKDLPLNISWIGFVCSGLFILRKSFS